MANPASVSPFRPEHPFLWGMPLERERRPVDEDAALKSDPSVACPRCALRRVISLPAPQFSQLSNEDNSDTYVTALF